MILAHAPKRQGLVVLRNRDLSFTGPIHARQRVHASGVPCSLRRPGD
jgi:hypothetical protein